MIQTLTSLISSLKKINLEKMLQYSRNRFLLLIWLTRLNLYVTLLHRLFWTCLIFRKCLSFSWGSTAWRKDGKLLSYRNTWRRSWDKASLNCSQSGEKEWESWTNFQSPTTWSTLSWLLSMPAFGLHSLSYIFLRWTTRASSITWLQSWTNSHTRSSWLGTFRLLRRMKGRNLRILFSQRLKKIVLRVAKLSSWVKTTINSKAPCPMSQAPDWVTRWWWISLVRKKWMVGRLQVKESLRRGGSWETKTFCTLVKMMMTDRKSVV